MENEDALKLEEVIKGYDYYVRYCEDKLAKLDPTDRLERVESEKVKFHLKEDRQLLKWLKELQRHREAWNNVKNHIIEKSQYRTVDLDEVLEIIDKALREDGESS